MRIFVERALLCVLSVASISFLVGLSIFTSKLFIVATRANQSATIAAELEEKIAALPEKPPKAVLLFVGDIMLSRSVGIKVRNKGEGDYRYPFLEVADALNSADMVFGNLESPISARGRNRGSIYSFRADPLSIEGLSYAGFDVLSLANNHIWDWGVDALRDTISILVSENILSVGAGANYEEANSPALFEVNGASIAVLAYTNLLPKSMQASEESPGLSDFDLDKVKESINTLSSQGYLVVVSLHWGDEYQTVANGGQEEIARGLIDAGADLIVGHHPHVVQQLEKYREGWVAYSLGNFVFDQFFSEETMRGAVLRVDLEKGNIVDVTLLPTQLSPDYQVSFVEPITSL
ncbi:MAG: CapA family protein [Candidatus Colwellbacteria bacterium]|nr:CapA family protein [Candidatus Colwellbacteria bacterium]